MINALEIVQSVAEAAGEPVPTTIEGLNVKLSTQKILKWVNHVGIALGHHYFWPWLIKEHTIITIPEYTTGTVAVTEGSATVTGTGTAWTEAMIGRQFRTAGFDEPYEVLTVPSATSLTLAIPYNGETSTSLGYTIYQNHYALPEDFDRELEIFSFVSIPSRINFVSFNEMIQNRRFPITKTTFFGTKEVSIVYVKNRKTVLEFSNLFDERIQIPVSYYASVQKFRRDSEDWGFPPHVESVIHDGALRFVHGIDKDDKRGEGFDLGTFFQGRQELVGLQPTTPRASFIPDTGKRRLMRARSRVGRGDADFGIYFDRDLIR